jgi:hypothetical protein
MKDGTMSISSTADTVAAKAASAATFGGSAGAIFGGINDWNAIATIGGIVIGLLGLALNWYYKQAALDLARERRRGPVEELEA